MFILLHFVIKFFKTEILLFKINSYIEITIVQTKICNFFVKNTYTNIKIKLV